MTIVTMLLTREGKPVSVYSDPQEAITRRDELNADPFIAEGQPDRDAPYSVEDWSVR